MAKRIAALVVIYVVVSVAWLVLGTVTLTRSNSFSARLSEEVAGLWGEPQAQYAPEVEFGWWTTRIERESVTDPQTNRTQVVSKEKRVFERRPVLLDSSQIDVAFDLQHRRKGLLWYATYGVSFNGEYSYTHPDEQDGFLIITYRFPTMRASYDEFTFEVNGQSDAQVTPVSSGGEKVIVEQVPIKQGDRVPFNISYTSRGLDSWRYALGDNVNRIKDFNLTMHTNFKAIDFPDGSMSPTTKTAVGDGWNLDWSFASLISGFNIGMEMPHKLNPGPVASQISLFAPVSLLFFFVWMFVISLLKGIDLHPIHYLFLSAAFFAFHLLMTYTVDHVGLLTSFLLSSAVSLFLVVSYLRLAVGLRFAALEAGLAQIVYLILFSYAHFYKGWTGLIVTIGSIVTLFVIMQLTGRINWNEKFTRKRPAPPTPPPPPQPTQG
ncbi:MAG: inner membrane CreD family protein [Candidatus Alcyoniella australis]|nr:inner membrane CreD family protein [Candidatus Alcyoniella australis]